MSAVAVRAQGLTKSYDGDLAMGPDAAAVAGNAAWLLVVTLALFAVPVTAMRRRLVA